LDFKLQLGDKLGHPQELTFVSDWGGQVQVTTLQLERQGVEALFLLAVCLLNEYH
jgi:hypothetical protein